MKTPTLLLVLALAACGGTEAPAPAPEPAPVAAPAPEPATDKAAKIAAIAVEIKANPDGFEAILTRHGTSQAEFEKALFEIAADPALSARYEAEMGR